MDTHYMVPQLVTTRFELNFDEKEGKEADVAQKTKYERSPFSASLKILKPTLFRQ
jgi:hypothetical protein